MICGVKSDFLSEMLHCSVRYDFQQRNVTCEESGGRRVQCRSSNNQRLAQPLCLRLPSSSESLLYLLHGCGSEVTVLVGGMRSRSISKAPSTAAMVLPKAATQFLTSAARPFLNLEKAVLLALASFLLPCHLRKSEGTAEILENASNASGTV